MEDLRRTVEALLDRFWQERAIAQTVNTGTMSDLVAPLDSISACEVLVDIEALVGFSVHAEDVIRKGGYDDEEQFRKELSEAVLAQVRKNAS